MVDAVIGSQVEPKSIVTFGGGLLFAQFIQNIHSDFSHPPQNPCVVDVHGGLDVLSCADEHVLASAAFVNIMKSKEILVFVQEIA